MNEEIIFALSQISWFITHFLTLFPWPWNQATSGESFRRHWRVRVFSSPMDHIIGNHSWFSLLPTVFPLGNSDLRAFSVLICCFFFSCIPIHKNENTHNAPRFSALSLFPWCRYFLKQLRVRGNLSWYLLEPNNKVTYAIHFSFFQCPRIRILREKLWRLNRTKSCFQGPGSTASISASMQCTHMKRTQIVSHDLDNLFHEHSFT